MTDAGSLKRRLKQWSRGDRPLVMGVVNVTPDSFSDGGRFHDPERAVEHALKLARDGADILDVGGESTRPGSRGVDEAEELARVMPVIEGIAAACSVPVSIDTSKPAVMRAAVAAGARMVNDINGLRNPDALETVADLNVATCIMHMLGTPRTMQEKPRYDSVVDDVGRFLLQRAQACLKAGMDRSAIVIDPGFGFGKTLNHNLALLGHLDELADTGFPLLVGLSRKAMMGAITGRRNPRDRLAATLAAQLLAAQRGAAIIRTHDVAEAVDSLKLLEAVENAARNPLE
ncbi:MAG TPA: dihydropteroate synthase [Wenzhouxiangella sp.]|nr:dihydropteroate synthase [Wenzhouxiangella sp.]